MAYERLKPMTGALGNTSIIIGTSQIQVLPIADARNYLAFQNDGLGAIYLAFGQNASVGFGMRLGASLGTLIFEHVVPINSVNAIASGVTSTLLITQG